MESEDSKKPINNQGVEEIENIRCAYQSLPQMVAFEGQKPWSALSVYIQLAFVLAAGAIIPNFLPDTSEFIKALVGIFLSLSGFTATLIWLSFDMRYRKISRYWVLSMRELENDLSISVTAFQRGEDFADGFKVSVSGEKIGYEGFEGFISVRTGFRIIYSVFLVVFTGLTIYNGYRLIAAMNPTL